MAYCDTQGVYIPTKECDDCSSITEQMEELEEAISDLQTAVAGKQDVLTAGANVTISDDEISADDTTYTLSITNGTITLIGSDGSSSVLNITQLNVGGYILAPMTVTQTDEDGTSHSYKVLGVEI